MTSDEAVKQLSRSRRGRNALRMLLALLDDGGISLDALNQFALLTLLQDAWAKPGSTRDLMREALEPTREEEPVPSLPGGRADINTEA